MDTTVEFIPLDSLIMNTIDPGILIHPSRIAITPATSSISLNRQSGLKGISGVSADMRQVLATRARGTHALG